MVHRLLQLLLRIGICPVQISGSDLFVEGGSYMLHIQEAVGRRKGSNTDLSRDCETSRSEPCDHGNPLHVVTLRAAARGSGPA